MLDAYIIDAIKREQERAREEGRPQIQLELPQFPELPSPARKNEREDEEDIGGPIVIPLVPDVEEDAA